MISSQAAAVLAATVMGRCTALGTISAEEGRLTRLAYTATMRKANQLVAGWMHKTGMAVHQDAAGNLVGRYPAARPGARTLVIGSHLDTVCDAGQYDGVLGVLVGIAMVEALASLGRRLPFAVEVVAFADEEGVRFGTSYMGSRAYTGQSHPSLLKLQDAAGVSLEAALRMFGGDPVHIGAEARRPQDLLAYLEVHIEQGPLLEARGLPLGVVGAIAGSTRAALRITGSPGHAGTVPMTLRRDALCAAAEIVLAAEDLARTTPGLVATVGQITANPGAPNVIPGLVTLSLDVRHQDDATRLSAVATLRDRVAACMLRRGVTFTWEELQSTLSVPMAPTLRARLSRAIAAVGYDALELPSGAGHDAAILAGVTAAAMLFVRCRGGISHHPAEAVEEADVAAALLTLGYFLEELAA